jgi:Ca-activated chloride channel family protein
VTFARPELLPLVPAVLAVLALAVYLQWRRRAQLERVFSAIALRRLFPVDVRRFPVARLACLLVAASAVAFAAVGPTRRTPEPPPPPAPLDLAIAVDVSASMAARDEAPSRIERARRVVDQVAAGLPSARIVLVVFADWPYTLVPPTDDPSVVEYFADALAADLVVERDQGTSLSAALAHARQALDLRVRPDARRAILVVSDGGAHDGESAVMAEVRTAVSAGFEVWTAGLGSDRGAPLESELGPVLDARGTPVMVRLDEELLGRVAAAGGGRYQHAGDDRGVRALIEGLRGPDRTAAAAGGAAADPTFLLALLALPLILLEGAWDGGRAVLRAKSREDDA